MVTQLTRDPLTHFHLWSVLRSSCREAVYVFALELDSFRILIVHWQQSGTNDITLCAYYSVHLFNDACRRCTFLNVFFRVLAVCSIRFISQTVWIFFCIRQFYFIEYCCVISFAGEFLCGTVSRAHRERKLYSPRSRIKSLLRDFFEFSKPRWWL